MRRRAPASARRMTDGAVKERRDEASAKGGRRRPFGKGGEVEHVETRP